MSLSAALGMFTVVPVPARELTPTDAQGALRWFPLVGAGLGAVAALPLVAVAQWAPHALPVAAVVAIGLLALLTRGLHLDGLADTVDGLGSGAPAERALAIMKKSDIGPFGVAAIVIVLLVDTLALTVLPQSVWTGCAALAVAAATGRLAAVHASSAAPARPDGFGALVQDAAGPLASAALTLVVLAGGGLLALAVGASWWWWVVVQVVALGAAHGLRRHTSRRFGGTTGDVYGALVETAATITLVGLCLR